MADGSIYIDTKIDESGLSEGLSKLGAATVKGIGKAVKWATAGLTAGMGAAVKFGSEFESAFAGVKKTVDATDEELAELRKGILDLSTVIPSAAADIAGVSEAAGQLGIHTESILKFTETMVNLGVATNLSAEDAASALAKFANIVGMSQDNFDKLGSTIVALGNNLATTEADIVEMSMRIAGTGKQVGLTEAQIMALSGALSSVGLEAEAGGSAISRVLSMMQLATETGAGLDDIAKVAGMTGDEFTQAFKRDATEALQTFLQGLNDAEKSGKSAIAVISELGANEALSQFDTIVVRDALLRAAGASGVLTDALALADEAWESNTALAKEASQRYETFESKLTMLANAAKNLGTAIYDGIQEPLKDVVLFAADLVSQLNTAFAAGGIGGLADALGDVLSQAVSKILEYVPSFVDCATKLVSGFVQGLTSAAPTIVASLTSVIGTLTEAFISITGDIAVLAGELIKGICDGLAANADTLIETLAKAIGQAIAKIADYLPVVIEAGANLIEAIARGVLNAVPTLLASAAEIIESLVNASSQLLPKLISQVGEIVAMICDTLVSQTPTLILAMGELVGALSEAIPPIIESIAEELPKLARR